MLSSLVAALSCFCIAIAAQTAQAANFTWATNVVSTDQGKDVSGNDVAANRSNSANALGDPSAAPQNAGELDSFSLGIGGSMVLSFGTPFSGQVIVYETTFDDRSVYPEATQILVSKDNVTYLPVTIIGNLTPSTTVTLSDFIGDPGPFNFLKLIDMTDPAPFLKDGFDLAADGFDVNAVGVTAAVPVPAAAQAGLVMLCAIAAFRVIRRQA
jgi:hypothetical protein